jgi:hypothetical protein
MKDSRVFHKSPTDDELSVAESTKSTPSLPIDHNRYVTFSHTVGGEYTIKYPNVFRFNELSIVTKFKDKILLELQKTKNQQRIDTY